MRVSLVTRIVAGYLLVLFLLGGTVLYSVNSMQEMKREVEIVKEGLLPTSGRFHRLAAELTKASGVLTRGKYKQILWLAHYLPDMEPFVALDSLRTSIEELSQQTQLPERTRREFAGISRKLIKLTNGTALYHQVEKRLKGVKVGGPDRTNRRVYADLVELFAARLSGSSEEKGGADARNVTSSLAIVIRFVRKEVMGLQAEYNLAINTAWSDAAGREESAVRIALYVGMASMVVIIAVFFLFLSWLRPLGTLKAFANRISRGEYDQPVPIKSGDEIGALAMELQTMAHRLKEREEMIRSQARELLRSDRFSTIGKMATQIAHEIRNPLNALGLKLELLEESVDEAVPGGEPNQDMTRLISAIGKEIDRLREITDYYLKFAKFPEVEKEQVELYTLLTDILAFYRDEAEQRGIALRGEIDRQLKAAADPNLLRHALANLLKNAIDAVGTVPEPRISVKAWREGEQIRITVKDNGPGIPAGESRRVFEPFFSTKKSGTGLGLTLVQQVVEEHGGEVACSSSSGEGTVFRISLPG